MNLIVLRNKKQIEDGRSNMLRYAFSNKLVADVVINCFHRDLCRSCRRTSIMHLQGNRSFGETVIALPEKWDVPLTDLKSKDRVISYGDDIPIPQDILADKGNKTYGQWFIISNGKFATKINNTLLEQSLSGIQADIIMFNAEPELLDGWEKLRLTLQGNVAGLRRLYSDALEFCPVPDDWPHHLFIKTKVVKDLLNNDCLSLSFQSFLKKCRSNSFNLRSVNIGGNVLDLETEDGLLNFCKLGFEEIHHSEFTIHKSANISEDARFVDKVLLGDNVRIDKNVVVIGPAIIGDNVRIKEDVVINSSIIDSGVSVPCNQIVNNRIIRKMDNDNICSLQNQSLRSSDLTDFSHKVISKYRNWPRFSYARLLKRFADIIAAIVVLIFFAPLIPLIALAIKVTSPGSIFYRDKRQGLHGKEFNCLKFRTMVTGADQIQEKLRFVSQVDGPQFKMEDDPRISVVGRFLRETYIDEIPQFLNVLLGQMSVVGPRPSPESENVSCPLWREARLSVRPGITGLWQISRTRQPMKDFQEWIRFDTEYVRNLSLKKDLWICWQTVRKLTDNFLDQF